ncbi:response regulator [Falsiroseomonas sp. HW251]|uniref:response regulator n=1 Tax=Falsiroseomonas sp. HW251 TaxID=3390998 RepID=UPI003D31F789
MDVLLVEDEALVREVLHEELAEAGLDVASVGSAEEGLDAVEQQGPPPVIVTDVNLGCGMDGVALAEEAHRRWPGVVVVVMMTGDDRNVARFRDGLCECCFLKPFNPQDLLAAVNDRCRLAA